MQLSPRKNLETCWNCNQLFPGTTIFVLDKNESTNLCHRCTIEWTDWYADRQEELRDHYPSEIN